MLKSADTGLRAVPFPIEDPERIPVQRYFDPEFYQREVEHFWPHVWQMACRLEQVPDEGDWIEYQNLGKSVIVVNTGPEERGGGGIKAYHNACRHRGVPIAGGKGNGHGNCKSSGFVCPFHGWRFDMHGENTFVYGKQLFSERQLDPDDINLIPCRVETWGGCAFINFDDDAPGVVETFGPITKSLDAHNVEHLRAEWWYATVLPANWKLAMEAFMEGYHVTKTHPQLHNCLPAMYDGLYLSKGGSSSTSETLSTMDLTGLTSREALAAQVRHLELISDGMAGQLHAKELEIARELAEGEFSDNPAEAVQQWFGMVMGEITTRLQARGEPVPNLLEVAVSDPLQGVEYLFPHYFLLAFFSSMASYRVRPLGPESCLFELWSLTMYPKGEEPEPIMEPTMLPYDSSQFPPIPRQDYSNIPIQQVGLHAKGFEYMRLAKDVEGLVSNYQRVIDGYLAGVPQEALATATNLLGGNFDGKIKDLGF
ncbi:MAG: aromatic ring-hydroxylating dioxygenase subunit alpha [Sphingomonadales bacterium]|nr:aromatic ring-hydroxylating dioxygenase subunit alpha [Sphingomonadales bacterium]